MNLKERQNFSNEDIQRDLLRPIQSYHDAKIHAAHLDQILGFHTAPIEEKLQSQFKPGQSSQNRQFWTGLDLQALQTPYSELVELILTLDPQPGEFWVDLGAGYGRLGLTLGLLDRQVDFLGFEFIPERVREGNRLLKFWQSQRAKLIQMDLADENWNPPLADLYFLYDFGSKLDIYKVLEKLRPLAQQRAICVVARGRGIKNWIYMDFPWLAQMTTPQVIGHCHVFRT